MLGFFIFLVSLPMIVALGHDAYLFYLNPDKGFEFSALGFIWTKYHPESYRDAIDHFGAETWNNFDFILTFKAFYVGLGFAAFFLIIIAIVKLIKGSSESKNTAKSAAKKWQRRG